MPKYAPGENPDGTTDMAKVAGVVPDGVTDSQLPVLLAVAVMGTDAVCSTSPSLAAFAPGDGPAGWEGER